MSWKTSGNLVSGPPTLSGHPSSHAKNNAGPSSQRLMDRLRPNGDGLNVFQRERQMLARYGDAYGAASRSGSSMERRTEWDVLKENHRFIREDEDSGEVSWEERLARAYESKLFKEFALIDLKHYKSKRFALRWRTAPEVVEGIGEDTCGSLRCRYHRPAPPAEEEWSDEDSDNMGRDRRRKRVRDDRGEKRRRKEKPPPSLRAFELPFVYEEAGQRKEALVKVKLCGRCEGKLKWKPPLEGSGRGGGRNSDEAEEEEEDKEGRRRTGTRHRDGEGGRSGRSRSPRRDRRPRDD